jgi:hypothetical protein
MSQRCFAFIILAYLLVQAHTVSGQSCSTSVLVVEQDGRVSAGSKLRLRSAVQAGLPLRIGWSIDFDGDRKPDLSHWADAVFITEFEGEIFTQIGEIRRQTPKRGEGHIELNASAQRWTGSLGSNGFLEGAFDDDQNPTRLRVRANWCIDPRVPHERLPASILAGSGQQGEIRSDLQKEASAALSSCALAWRLVYRHDADGQPLTGTKQALFEAIRRGAPIRLAWGTRVDRSGTTLSVEHSADPVFVTIVSNREVVVQLPEHIAQRSYVEVSGSVFESPDVMWRGLMRTDGTFDAVWVNRATGEEARRLPQRVGLTWLALLPSSGCSGQSPIELAVPGGVRRANE